MNATTKQIERILTLGMAMLTPEVRKERMESVIDGRVINGSVLASLIDECKVGLSLFVDKYGQKVKNVTEIKTMLVEIDGKTAVASADPDELVEVVLELKKWVTERVL